MNEVRSHHFVPQFFMKSWAISNGKKNKKEKKNIINTYNVKDNRYFPGTTRNVGAKENLYTFNDSEIETTFINPYIDSPLEKYLKEAISKSWNELTDSSKKGFFKFMLLLEVRNPTVLESIATAYRSIPRTFVYSSDSIDHEKVDEVITDEIFIFMCIAIHELELKNFEEIEDKKTRKMLEGIRKSIEENVIKNDLFSNYLSYLLRPNVICEEVIDDTNSFITCTSPIRRLGSYDGNFLVVLNVSPRKSLIFSNKKEMINAIVRHSKEDVIKNINNLNTSAISKEIGEPDIVIYPFN